MEIKQFEDKNLSHYSYAILSHCEKKVVLIDPSRDPKQYLDYAKKEGARIIGIIETHPHADFVSSHLELEEATGADIYISKLVSPSYPYIPFDEGNSIEFGKIKLSAINTPGHSPDSICVLLEHEGKQKAIFTGDTLFIGDCGRPDLREGVGSIRSKREDLARQLYHSLRDKLMKLDDEVIVYPAHGAGTLCGKNLSPESSNTLGNEKQANWSLQQLTEEEFTRSLLSDQPFIPLYFPFDVELNRRGAIGVEKSISGIKIKAVDQGQALSDIDEGTWVIDSRPAEVFRNGHLGHAINLMEDGKFETWLGSILEPGEAFYVAGKDEEQVKRMLYRVASIGYENALKGGLIVNGASLTEKELDVTTFKNHLDDYTIVDVRNTEEVNKAKIFPNSLSIPLPDLRKRLGEIPTNKPIVVHCAGGYRSAAASSLLRSTLKDEISIYDLGEAVKQFMD